jgi:hypothetical protein
VEWVSLPASSARWLKNEIYLAHTDRRRKQPEQVSFPTYGERTIAYQVKVPVDVNDLNLPAYLDLIVVV